MTSNDTFDSSYCIISQGEDNENSLMLKIEFFSTEEYVKTIGNDVQKINSFGQGGLTTKETERLCSDKHAHHLKSKLKSRISKTFNRVKARSWISSRCRLQEAKSKHNQICEFINAAVGQTINSNEKRHKSIKIKNIDQMSNSDQSEESTYNSLQYLKDCKTKDQMLQDELFEELAKLH